MIVVSTISDHSNNQTGLVDDQSGGTIRSEKLYPVQISLPAQQGSGETGPRVLTIHVPESAITGKVSKGDRGHFKGWLKINSETLSCT